MNQQSASLGGIMNSLKWGIVLFLVVVGIIGNYQYSEQPLIVRIVGLAVLAMVAILIASRTEKGKRFVQFAQEARIELKKVVWPNRKETVQTTIMVLGVVAIVGLILWAVDILLLDIVRRLIGYGAS